MFICGQSLSGTVNFTCRDLIESWHKDKSCLILLEDSKWFYLVNKCGSIIILWGRWCSDNYNTCSDICDARQGRGSRSILELFPFTRMRCIQYKRCLSRTLKKEQPAANAFFCCPCKYILSLHIIQYMQCMYINNLVIFVTKCNMPSSSLSL